MRSSGLRTKAYDNKKLVTTKQQKVSVQTQESKQVIVIEPADADTMYVPYYEPATVYGAWPYADYPPYYFGYPSYIGAGVVAAGLAFGTAWAIGRWGNYWGGGCNWGNRNVYVNHRNHQHRKRLAAQSGASPGRALQQRECSAALRQQQPEGRSLRPNGFPRPRRQQDRPVQEIGLQEIVPAIVRETAQAIEVVTVGRGGIAPRAEAIAPPRVVPRTPATRRALPRAAAVPRRANRGGGGGALNVSSGRSAAAASARGRSSMASAGPRGGGARELRRSWRRWQYQPVAAEEAVEEVVAAVVVEEGGAPTSR